MVHETISDRLLLCFTAFTYTLAHVNQFSIRQRTVLTVMNVLVGKGKETRTIYHSSLPALPPFQIISVGAFICIV